jgi:sterol desaturase/sphingolipid hydroxylase (fatty acid hydroxylase superfamily)
MWTLIIIEPIFYFFLWTFILYWIHRLTHEIQGAIRLHRHHHDYVRKHIITWHWSNLFLYNDNWLSTFDLWVTEVVPTIIFSWITGQWWISIVFYLYAALIQERLEHNSKFNMYPIYVAGKWHMLHHTSYRCNYGIITPFWDWVFKTNRFFR